MAITVPTIGSEIDVVTFGKPVADGVNANAAAIAALQSTAWIALAFTNGWMNYGQGFATGQYRKIGDMVQMRGLIKLGTLLSAIAVLPVGYRPPGTLQFAVDEAGNHAMIQVDTGGNVSCGKGGNTALNIQCSFSLTA